MHACRPTYKWMDGQMDRGGYLQLCLLRKRDCFSIAILMSKTKLLFSIINYFELVWTDFLTWMLRLQQWQIFTQHENKKKFNWSIECHLVFVLEFIPEATCSEVIWKSLGRKIKRVLTAGTMTWFMVLIFSAEYAHCIRIKITLYSGLPHTLPPHSQTPFVFPISNPIMYVQWLMPPIQHRDFKSC